jgi:hypothetical protein
VIAASDGTVEKLFNSVRGGITIYERSPDQKWVYYYAHLSAYAPGLARRAGAEARTGDRPGWPYRRCKRGRPAPPFRGQFHGSGERWWHGTPINPYPLLAGNRGAR